MAQMRVYSDQQVETLLREYRQTGEARLRDQVVEQMRPLVRSVARKFAGREPLEDLESEGFVGLIRAVDRFQPGRGARFSTFAMHLVAGQIRHHLRDRGHLIRQPAWLQELDTRVQRTARDLQQRLGREPSVEELAEATNLTEEGVEELLAARQAAHVLRLDTAANDDDEYLQVDEEKIKSKEYVTLQLPIEDRIALEGALQKLKELERKVVYYFFYQDFTQSEIARKLGISCNYAGYVLRNGLKHLREGLPGERAVAAPAPSGEESVIDAASGLYTERHFTRRLTEEVSRAQRAETRLAVACLRLPSESPEELVRQAGDVVRQLTRRSDVVARIGPREIGILLPGAGEIAARVVRGIADRLEDLFAVPVACGSVVFPEDARSAERLLAEAHAAAAPAPASTAKPVPVGAL